jgi:roadblock/LC7 domain-containing protein
VVAKTCYERKMMGIELMEKMVEKEENWMAACLFGYGNQLGNVQASGVFEILELEYVDSIEYSFHELL